MPQPPFLCPETQAFGKVQAHLLFLSRSGRLIRLIKGREFLSRPFGERMSTGELGELLMHVADVAKLGKAFEEHRHKLLFMVKQRLDPTLANRLDPEDVLSDAFVKAQRGEKV